jgi:hypothetical protein
MERIIPSTPGAPPPLSDDFAGAKVFLKNRHLCIAADLAQQAFGAAQQVYAVYYANLNALLLAPSDDQLFKQAHECAMIMLKTRTAQGDKSLSLEEILLDHDIAEGDRRLDYVAAPGLRMLQVKMGG